VSRISGPLLDPIDIHIDVTAVKFKVLASDTVIEAGSNLDPFSKCYGRALSSGTECADERMCRRDLHQGQ